MRHIWIRLAFVVMFLGGCSRDNGLPDDLGDHLRAQGISLQVLGSEAPISSRAGFLYIEQDDELEELIIDRFDLLEIERGSSEFNSVSARVEADPVVLWGISGRPLKLKLRDGGQFEYLYVLRTKKGITYLLAEYAYG